MTIDSDLSLRDLKSFAARLKSGAGPVKISIRVRAVDPKKVMPEDDLISTMRAYFRNGKRVVDTFVFGGEGVIDFDVSPALDAEIQRCIQALQNHDAQSSQALADLGVATIVLRATVRTVLFRGADLPEGMPLDSLDSQWDIREGKCRRALSATLMAECIETKAQFGKSDHLRDRANMLMTKAALLIVRSDKQMHVLVRLAMKEGFICAWKFQRDLEEIEKGRLSAQQPEIDALDTGAYEPLVTDDFQAQKPETDERPVGLGPRPSVRKKTE